MDTTAVLAVYGTIVSTIGLAVSALNYRRDKGRLEISARVGKLVTPGTDAPDDDELPTTVFISVTNVGRRPVFFKGIGGRISWHPKPSKRQGFVIISRNQPQVVAEAHYFQEIFPLTQQFREIVRKAKSLHAYDSVGRYYRLSGRLLRKLKRDVEAAKLVPDKTTHEDLERGLNIERITDAGSARRSPQRSR